jgi:hypothetical protein
MIGRLEIPTINPVVIISTPNKTIIIPHAMLILVRVLEIKIELILVDWKRIYEAKTIAKW